MRKMQKNITITSVAVSLLLSCTSAPNSNSSTSDRTKDTVLLIEEVPDDTPSIWTEIDFQEEGYVEQLAYARTENFIGEAIYPCARCFLRPEAALALDSARVFALDMGLNLILFDCYRPTKHQQEMFDIIQDSRYVAEPKQGGSMHNKGLAVDLALTDSAGVLLDFGGDFDEFSERSHLAFAGLSEEARSNRDLLVSLMKRAGFTPYPYEWWHFSYQKHDYELDDFIWNCD